MGIYPNGSDPKDNGEVLGEVQLEEIYIKDAKEPIWALSKDFTQDKDEMRRICKLLGVRDNENDLLGACLKAIGKG
jgi:hypothetical protein